MNKQSAQRFQLIIKPEGDTRKFVTAGHVEQSVAKYLSTVLPEEIKLLAKNLTKSLVQGVKELQ